MPRFAKLAVATTVATLVLIALGGVVRAMEAGLGCPDWPTCYGAPNPPSELAAGPFRLAWIEHSHRLWASVVMLLIFALALAARRTGQPRDIRRATRWLVPTVLSQALLGAVVVWAKLDAETVTLHLAGALTVLALSGYVTLRAVGRGPAARDRLRETPRGRVLELTGLAVVAVTGVQMLVGSTVTGYEAGLAFTTFPDFDGRVVPELTAHVAPWLHVVHRMLAYAVAALVVALAVRARRTPAVDALVVRLSSIAVALVVVQIGLGAANIWWRLSAWSVVPHLVVGALIWLTAVWLLLLLRWQGAPSEAEPRSHVRTLVAP